MEISGVTYINKFNEQLIHIQQFLFYISIIIVSTSFYHLQTLILYYVINLYVY